MKKIILLALVLVSCDFNTQKYAEKAKDVDGDPCKTYILSDYSNFEIARCVEKQIYFISPIGDFLKFQDLFFKKAALIYVRDESNFEILKNKKIMNQIFEGFKPNWTIFKFYLNDSTMEIEFFNDSFRPTDYFTVKYKIK